MRFLAVVLVLSAFVFGEDWEQLERGVISDVTGIAEAKNGDIFVSSEFGCYNITNWNKLSENGFPDEDARGLVFDSKNKLYIAFGHAIWTWDGNKKESYPLPDDGRVFNIDIISGDRIIVSWGRGIWEFKDGKFLELHKDAGGTAEGVAETKDGLLWVATLNNGVFSVNKNGITRYNKEKGFNSDNTLDIVSDGKDNIWVATSQGLAQITADKRVKMHLINAEQTDGENDIYSVIATPDGSVWVNNRKNIYRFDGKEFHLSGKKFQFGEGYTFYFSKNKTLYAGSGWDIFKYTGPIKFDSPVRRPSIQPSTISKYRNIISFPAGRPSALSVRNALGQTLYQAHGTPEAGTLEFTLPETLTKKHHLFYQLTPDRSAYE